MSMEITNNYNNYLTGYANNSSKAGNAGNCKNDENGITTSTVELKTSKGVNKTEQIKTGFSNVNDYLKYLQEKYSYVNIGTTSMSGVPTTVTVSESFLKKCMNDPKKAAYLEENLAAIPDCVNRSIAGCVSTVTSLNYNFDASGEISIARSSSHASSGNSARTNSGRKTPEQITKENMEKKAKEKKAAEKKAEKKRAEKKAEEDRIAKRRADKEQMEKLIAGESKNKITVTGNNVADLTQSIVMSANTGSFDIKA